MARLCGFVEAFSLLMEFEVQAARIPSHLFEVSLCHGNAKEEALAGDLFSEALRGFLGIFGLASKGKVVWRGGKGTSDGCNPRAPKV